MITFKVENLDPVFVFSKPKMTKVMHEICILLSFADGPDVKSLGNSNLNTITKNDYTFNYNKSSDFGGLTIEFFKKSVFLLKLKNCNSTSIEITLNIKKPVLEMAEIFFLLKPYQSSIKNTDRPSDGL